MPRGEEISFNEGELELITLWFGCSFGVTLTLTLTLTPNPHP